MSDDLPDPVLRDLRPGPDLRADCARCVGLCCVAPAFAASSDFAIDKPAGVPCPHLGPGFDCTIHDRLRDRGFPGCSVFDCFGAGQKVVQTTYGATRTSPDVDWRADADRAAQLFDVFTVMRQLHELLWYLTSALTYPAARPRWPRVQGLLEETDRLSRSEPDTLLALDLPGHRVRVTDELREVSRLVRTGDRPPRPGRTGRRGAGRGSVPELSGRDLMGRDLRRRDLRHADLRGTYLIGADLRGVDLTGADVIGADLRGADVRDADLSGALFLTQLQVNAARGDAGTRLPGVLTRPPSWPGRP